MAKHHALMCRIVQGLAYASALGMFLMAVHVYLWPSGTSCAEGQSCPPGYVWPMLGMAFSGALADSVKKAHD
jgi:hypothetical protein